jgi:phosphoribosyl 1,2-cyclic phosphate phosphodiesterase
MKVNILGCGTSTGVPLVCCTCAVCISTNPKNKRLRTSIYISTDCGQSVLVDTGPDLRQQCLRANITNIDKVLYTHCHADHVFGIDDLRPFNFKKKQAIQIYADDITAQDLLRNFQYCFSESRNGSSVPELKLNKITPYESFKVGNTDFMPLPILHGKMRVISYRVGNFAYLTDGSAIPDKTKEHLQNLDILIINGLRERPHNTHFTIAEAVKEIESIRPKKAFLTHLSHEIDYELGNQRLKQISKLDIELAYDGLELAIN